MLVAVENRDKAPAFFQSRTIVPNKPIQSADMRVMLESAELLPITGTASDSQGKPLPEAEVFLFGGMADETWVMQAHPEGGSFILNSRALSPAGRCSCGQRRPLHVLDITPRSAGQ